MSKNILSLVLVITTTIINGKNEYTINEPNVRNNARNIVHTIDAGSYYYQPSHLNINLGDTVRFINQDGYHDVQVTSGPEILTLDACDGPCTIGDLVFNIVGDYTYLCSIGSHADQGMVGSVSVRWQPQTKEELKELLQSWNSSSSSATQQEIFSIYGPINEWDVSLITDMSYLFDYLGSFRYFEDDISGWDVSNVTDMNNMFYNSKFFNGNISGWDVSNVTDMSSMFKFARGFNGDISNWNVSSVTNMNSMFYCAWSFNGDISNWDVSNVVDMESMFLYWENNEPEYEPVFNSDLSNWNVSSVTNMSSMFEGAEVFHSNLSSWDVSNVTDMSNMFLNARNFNGDLSNWNVSSVANMTRMFYGAMIFNSDLSLWDVSSVTNMSEIFSGAEAFNSDLSSWNVSNVNDMSRMFKWATEFNSDLSNWDVSNVLNMKEMFAGKIIVDDSTWYNHTYISNFNSDISSWDVSNVTDFGSMFVHAVSFNQDISSWNVSNATSSFGNWGGAKSLSRENRCAINTSWEVQSEFWIDQNEFNRAWFKYSCGDSFAPENNDFLSRALWWNSINLPHPSGMDIHDSVHTWNVSNVVNMSSLFDNDSWALDFNEDITNWDVSNVNSMYRMFGQAESFNQDISNWDISNVLEMDMMFDNALSLSAENRCSIHTNFSANESWLYDWASYCALSLDENYLTPENFALHQNYPNPFNPITKIQYDLPESKFVNINIYDIMGRKIKSLVNSVQDAGYRSIYWDATNDLGQFISAGTYIFTIQVGDFRQTKKMVLLK